MKGLGNLIKELWNDVKGLYRRGQIYEGKKLLESGCSKISLNVFYDKKNDIYYQRIDETDYFSITKVNKAFGSRNHPFFNP